MGMYHSRVSSRLDLGDKSKKYLQWEAEPTPSINLSHFRKDVYWQLLNRATDLHKK